MHDVNVFPRSEFDNEASPDLHKDLYLQDIHCVSSLCKAYFRELPNPLLTYNLYDKFAVSDQHASFVCLMAKAEHIQYMYTVPLSPGHKWDEDVQKQSETKEKIYIQRKRETCMCNGVRLLVEKDPISDRRLGFKNYL